MDKLSNEIILFHTTTGEKNTINIDTGYITN